MWRVYLTLACLSLCASCAAPQAPRQVVVTEYQCFMRPEFLQPTTTPPLQDQTVGELLDETRQLREALLSCNQDKDKARRLIENQAPTKAAASTGPTF